MKVGLCKCCGTKIGHKTANGFFSYEKNKKQQVLCSYEYAIGEGISHTAYVVCVLCKACAKTADKSEIEKGLATDASFIQFKKEHPDAKFVSCEPDPLDVN